MSHVLCVADDPFIKEAIFLSFCLLHNPADAVKVLILSEFDKVIA